MSLGRSTIVSPESAESLGNFIRIINVIYITFLWIKKMWEFIHSYGICWNPKKNVSFNILFFNHLKGWCSLLISRIFRPCRLEDFLLICYNYNRVMSGCMVVVGMTVYSAGAENARLTPEGTIESDYLIVTLELTGGENTTAINYTLRYDPEKLEPVGVTPGSSVSAGEKSLADNVVAPGQWTMVIMGLNQRTIPDGDIAVAEFRLRSSSESTIEVVVEEPVLSTWEGDEIPVTGGRYEMVVRSGDTKQPADSKFTESNAGAYKPHQQWITTGGRLSEDTPQPSPQQYSEKEEVDVSTPRHVAQTQGNSIAENTGSGDPEEGSGAKGNDVIRDEKSGVTLTGHAVTDAKKASPGKKSSLTVEDEGLGEAKATAPLPGSRSSVKKWSEIWVWAVGAGFLVAGIGLLVMRLRSTRR